MPIDTLPTDTTPLDTAPESDIVEQAPEPSPEPTEVPETTPPKEDLPGYDPKDSARDSALKAFKELSGQKDAPSKEETPKTEAKPVQRGPGRPKKEVPQDDKFDPELHAPERFSPEGKKAFNAAPPEVKREVHRAIKNMEGATTRAQQQYSQAYQNIQSTAEILKPFAGKWAEKGFTVPQALGEICSTFEKLNNPQTAIQEFVSLGQRMGIDFNQLAQAQAQGQIPQMQVPQIDPQIQAMQERQNQLESYLAQQQIQMQTAPVVNEARSLMDQVDQTGNLKFPELHDNDYLLSLKPRVSELLGSIPGLSFNDALLRANEEKKAKIFGISQSNQPSRLPGQNNSSQRTNAVNAAVSVRGRSAPQAISGDFGEPPPEALKNARATTAWALQKIREGRL